MAKDLKPGRHSEDGAAYAEGSVLMVAPVHNKITRSITMGGPVADCQNEETAIELADCYNRVKKLGPYRED